MEVGCVIFGMNHKKSQKLRERKWSIRLEWRGGLNGFQTVIHPGGYMAAIIQHVTSEKFTWCSLSDADNRNQQIHGSVTMHTDGSVPFTAHAKRMVILI